MGQPFLQSKRLFLTQVAPGQGFLLLHQVLNQRFFSLQGASKIPKQLFDEEMQDTAGNRVTHVHFNHIEASHHVSFDSRYLFLFLDINSKDKLDAGSPLVIIYQLLATQVKHVFDWISKRKGLLSQRLLTCDTLR